MRKIINDLLILFGLGIIVTLGWQDLEIFMTGKINPNNVDSIVGIILTLSLFGNLKMSSKSNKGDDSN